LTPVRAPNSIEQMSVPEIADHYSVALEGFSTFERDALASFFRLAAERTPAYHRVDEAGLSDFLIADADQASALQAVRQGRRLRDTVFIGRRAPEGAVVCLPRPLDPMRIVRALDRLLELRLALPPEAPSGLMPLDFEAPAGAPAALPPAVAAAPSSKAKPRGGAGRDVLVVEDSAIARKFLQQRLERLGYHVQAVASGEEALRLLEQRAYTIAFLDVLLGAPGSVDGLQLCRAVKQQAARLGVSTPVVLVTSLKGSSDRVRGSLAGCDAYLTKPLLEEPFIATLQQIDPAFEWPAAAPA
jgi:two-component system cell cycle response regulator